MEDRYNPQEIELKWQSEWEKRQLYRTQEDSGRPKFYCLEMFPYPSGDLHIGHVRNYSIGDAVARYHRSRGYNVLYPMGFDAFGQPTEAAAIKRNTHPATWTHECIDRMRRQFRRLGNSYDWDREVVTCDPRYYRWNQWFFLKFLERGLAYRAEASVNWCANCQFVLSDEEAQGGKCWRCDGTVTKQPRTQWFIKITEYADELLNDLEQLTEWPAQVCIMQSNWIGRSEGVEFDLEVAASPTGETPVPLTSAESRPKIRVFTTRVDTVFGVTYVVLAPEHPLVDQLISGDKIAEVAAYRARVAARTNVERISEEDREGIPLGVDAINPANGEHIPIWIADYVLLEYGTGAIMAVPAHDQRDFEFAHAHNLPIRAVIQPLSSGADFQSALEAAYTDPGIQVNSGDFDGLPSEEAKVKIAEWFESRGVGERKINYRLRDWLVSRQRYWGTPIPIIYCDGCGAVPVPESDLPVVLPTDLPFAATGEVLPTAESFVNTTCPKCGAMARRETDTMAQWIESCWYFLRYTDPQNDRAPFRREIAELWMPVDNYFGGIEHAVLHLFYSRFFTKVLRDLGMINIAEPFRRYFAHGMVLLGGAVMSKSRGGLGPDEIIARYGADALRTYVLFMGPPEAEADWKEGGIEGISRFLNRAWRAVIGRLDHFDPEWRQRFCRAGMSEARRQRANACQPEIQEMAGMPQASTTPSDMPALQLGPAAVELRRKTHQTIRQVTNDIERMHFNTAISALMELVNAMTAVADPGKERGMIEAYFEACEHLPLLLAPFAPHLAEELWHRLGHTESVHLANWPQWDEKAAREEEITIVVQVDGRLRDRLTVAPGLAEVKLRELALASDKVKSHLAGKTVQNVVIVPNRLVSIVTK